jgi:predicted Zn-dependent peptidase
MGATDFNGTTWFDRTNYFETVPKGALERALFLESDRMGHLLGAVTQDKLSNQIGVVQNEKRQGDNQPYGLVEYAQLKGTVPADHPYGHSTIGSMADLDAASLEDVKNWFRAHYGPNNAVLVLAGDIDAKAAKPLVEKWFGDIPAGPRQARLTVAVPTLDAPRSEVMKDNVATTRHYRYWAVPGIDSTDAVPLKVAATVLGGLASSRLDNALVRGEKLAVAVTASYQDFAQLGWVEVTADVRPGVDSALVAKRLDEILADFIKTGPTADEVRRVATRAVAERIDGLEQVGGFGGKAVALAEGELYRDDADAYKKDLVALSKVKPAEVTKAMQKWLTRSRWFPASARPIRNRVRSSRAGQRRHPHIIVHPRRVNSRWRRPRVSVRRKCRPVPPARLRLPTARNCPMSARLPISTSRRWSAPSSRTGFRSSMSSAMPCR